MRRTLPLLALVWVTVSGQALAESFDHGYADYGRLLAAAVQGSRIDYGVLTGRRQELERVVGGFGAVPAEEEPGWTREQRLAYWINAYNLFTLKAIVDHYPIRGSWLSRYPRNSIRQIDGAWTELTFRAAGKDVTLDWIEHELLRPTFNDARIHFAVNCASASCPPLRAEPYVAETLDAQLDDAARRYLASPHGVQVDGSTLRVSSIFDWYGNDFVPAFAARVAASRPERERAILGTIATFGPAEAQNLARRAGTRIRFLRYDWSLNDVQR